MNQEEPLLNEEEDLFDIFKNTADKGQTPLRVDKFLMMRMEGVSRSKIQAAAHAGNVYINGKTVKPNQKVKGLDELMVVFPRTQAYELKAENLPLDIVYEDHDLLVLNKQAGMVVHPGVGNHSGTLVNALIYHFENLPSRDDLSRPGLVHRLDKDTSGLMVIAKTESAMNVLARKFFERNLDRKYVALVWGNVEEEEGTINAPIGRHPRFRKLMGIVEEEDGGKHAITHYKVIERFGYTTLVECKLETGRTHQIRVHMRSIGHTIFNDERYGGHEILKGTIYSKYQQFVDNCFKLCPRQALHAKVLGFEHPSSGEKMYWEAEPPADMTALIEKWRKYAENLRLDT